MTETSVVASETERLLRGFNSRGNLAGLERAAAEGLRVSLLRSTAHDFPDGRIEFRLFELLPE
ncbi:hypothetical protein ACFV6F_18285 [Kitasatospora phosalacinea]|uniref:hypothetical protein n=1 Tax=Kitasatospora phosalacinea TaxID=2065 RepID=UPI0036528DE3